jgi:hypothetical protein
MIPRLSTIGASTGTCSSHTSTYPFAYTVQMSSAHQTQNNLSDFERDHSCTQQCQILVEMHKSSLCEVID